MTGRPALHDAAVHRTLIQLVAPGAGGVRDYLECLRMCWRESGLDSRIIVLSEEEAREQPLAARLRALLGVERQPCTLLLHFSGYGFERRGLCLWLARELERARREFGAELRIVTMFHELFASGPVWRSAFWLSGVQAWIATRVARASDALWTNTEGHARWLRGRVGAAIPIEIHPVFSTIGEPASISPVHWRDSRLVVFGSESTRHRALAHLPRHAAALRSLQLREVIEVGSGAAFAGAAIAALEHRFAGELDVGRLHELLGSSAFALIDYPPEYLGKSSVFAAYAAHGCVVLNTADATCDTDGLERGVHYVALRSCAELPSGADARKALGTAARDWYAAHALAPQAAAFARSCEAAPLIEAAHG